MIDYRDQKVSAKQIKSAAWRYSRKLGASHEPADLEQEFWIVWMKAVDTFNPEQGVEFGAWLEFLMRRRASGLRDRDMSGKRFARVVSLQDRISEDSTLEDVIASEGTTCDEDIIERETLEIAKSCMHPRMLALVEALENPPEILKREIAAAAAKAEFAKSIGKRSRATLSLTMFDNLFGISRNTRSNDKKKAAARFEKTARKKGLVR